MIGALLGYFVPVFIIPLSFLIIGIVFLVRPPKEVNYLFGYRTRMSMINDKTWAFAHKLCGKYFIIIASVSLVLSTIIYFVVCHIYGVSTRVCSNTCIILVAISAVAPIFVLIPIEIALRKKFDNFGREKETLKELEESGESEKEEKME